jgi:hypothetical protein
MDRTKVALIVCTAALTVALMLHGPVPQPVSYHDFADGRALGGLPNYQNVLTNLLFLLAGILGWLDGRSHPRSRRSAAWRLVFLGAAGVFLASSWYHLRPSDATLVWDRLAMAFAFMAYFVALIEEYVDERIDVRWLWLLLPLAFVAVGHWYVSGDLRAWIVAQGTPMLATPVVLLLSPRRYGGEAYLWAALACYVAAKAAEFADGALYTITGNMVSGHAAKHVLAGAGVLCLWQMLRRREAQDRRPCASAPSYR